jgi:hypothetical protein
MFVCEMCCIHSIETINIVFTGIRSFRNMWAMEQVSVVMDILR